MTETQAAVDDRGLKAKHRAMWALGDYPAVAAAVIPDLGGVLVEACHIAAGQHVLDVAAGSGNAATPAAALGAHVIAGDLSPRLLDAGRRLAAERGVELDWRELDAEALPFPDRRFDTVMSCVGVMFAPHHQAAANELLRVCRPGGTIGLINWTPEGFVGQMFAAMKPYVAPPPPDAQPPPLWGTEAHVRDLFADRVTDLVAQRRTVRVEVFASGEEFRDFFKTRYGPTVAAYSGLGGDAERVAGLDRDLADLARRQETSPRSGAMEWEYLLVTARKRD